MSTGGDSVVGASDPKEYFCYQCNVVVTIIVSPTADLVCPACAGDFLEEYENPNPNPPNPHHQQAPESFFSFSSSYDHSGSSSADLIQFAPGFRLAFGDDGHGNEPLNPAALFGLGGGGGGALGGQNRSGYVEADADAFNPMMFLQNYLNNLRAGGANIQFVIDSSGSGAEGGFRLPSNLGDYFVGPGLEQLIQQLAENDPNRYGTPPASKEAVEKLPYIQITEELLASDNAQCAVCMDTFELEGKAKQIPCKHIYHPDCILPWLELHNSCPVCRYELPTDDPYYEQHAADGQGGSVNARAAVGSVNLASTGLSSSSSEENPGGGDRRFRIQLPWPFNSFGSGSDGSNSGGSNNDNENSGGRSRQ